MKEEFISIIPESDDLIEQTPSQWSEYKRKYSLTNSDRKYIIAVGDGARSSADIKNSVPGITYNAVYYRTHRLIECGIFIMDCKINPSGIRSFVRFRLSSAGKDIYQFIKDNP